MARVRSVTRRGSVTLKVLHRAVVAGSVALAACAAILSGTDSRTAPPVEVVRLVYQASFADPQNGPPVFDERTVAARYADAALELELKTSTSWRPAPPMEAVRDSRVEADIDFRSPLITNGDRVPSAGVTCRVTPAQWFFFRIWTTGSVSIFRIRGANAEEWLRVPATRTTVPIAGTLHVAADCVGGEGSPLFLTLSVNGARVLNAVDDQPGPLAGPARAGIMVDAGDFPPLVVRYRNFTVRELRRTGA